MTTPIVDVVVVGAGIVGAATAWRLAEAGARVLVLEGGTVAGGATGNSFSWLNAVSKEPEAYHRLNALGMAEYEAVGRALGEEVRRGGGCLEWVDTEDGMRRLAERVARLRARGYAVRWLNPQEVAELEPGVVLGSAAAAAYYERDTWVDAPTVTRALIARARALGAEVRERAPVTALHAKGARVEAVSAGGARIEAGAVVICAGTGTPALTQMLGFSLPLARRPGLLAVTTPVPAGTLGRVIYAPGVHARPDVSGGLRLGAEDVDAFTREDTPREPPPGVAGVLVARLYAALRVPPATRVQRVYVGVRPVPVDGVSVVGRLPGWENAYVAVTHSGVTLGPLLGRLLAQEVTTGRPDPLLAPFRPDRFVAR
jgi:glycine/D-amino acid oxidase-like deaminating enzyme